MCGIVTDKLTYLEEGDWAAITRSTVQAFDARGCQVDRPIATIAVESATVAKSGHRHFMAKEMAEQPSIIQKALAAYTNDADGTLNLPEGVQFKDIRRVVMVACGTAFYACQVAKYWFEQIARITVEIDIASEFRYRDPVLERDDLLIVVSQSGETADTLAALRHVRRTLAVVNVPTSSIAREADVVMPILAGPEIGVASTKAFTAQLLSLLLLASKAGLDRGKMNADDLNTLMSEIQAVPDLMSQALDLEQDYARVAEKLAESDDVLFLGRGAMFPMALEAAGELKHGPIALIDKTLPVAIFAPRDVLFEKTTSNMQEVMARHGQVTLLTDSEGAKLAGEAQNVIVMPKVPVIVAPLIYAIPAQMLAYNTAIARRTDVDQPRNLAKSVTVE
jgi:glucosamine--fructose-6-phosphate aminotransferase (isomerizing)